MNKKQLSPCGCGGEAKVISYLSREYCKMAYYVRCVECGTETDDLHSEDEAIDAWNRAMGSAEKSSTVERTAKVKDIVHTHGYPDEGLCGNCNEDVNGLYDYCPYCGARLEWDE